MKLDAASACLESLGNSTRLAIYRALVRAGPAGLPVGKLQARLDIPGSTLSHHIAHLVKNDLVSQAREGRVLRCTANYRTMNDLITYLSDECCRDTPRTT
jgi:DNA-binding transcriptional ArsR family regulator